MAVNDSLLNSAREIVCPEILAFPPGLLRKAMRGIDTALRDAIFTPWLDRDRERRQGKLAQGPPVLDGHSCRFAHVLNDGLKQFFDRLLRGLVAFQFVRPRQQRSPFWPRMSIRISCLGATVASLAQVETSLLKPDR